jgi:Na+/H+ antiporter 1
VATCRASASSARARHAEVADVSQVGCLSSLSASSANAIVRPGDQTRAAHRRATRSARRGSSRGRSGGRHDRATPPSTSRLRPGAMPSEGFGIAMATDVAFAHGVLTLAGRLPSGLKALLLTLAIVDDLGSVVVVAFRLSAWDRPSPVCRGRGCPNHLRPPVAHQRSSRGCVRGRRRRRVGGSCGGGRLADAGRSGARVLNQRSPRE